MGKYIFDAILIPEEEGGYSVEVPALLGCLTCGDTYAEAAEMAADAIKTWIASTLRHGEQVPEYRKETASKGCERITIYVETDDSWILDEPVLSAAEAARELGLTAGRITHLIDAGMLEGYRDGKHTWVTAASVKRRKQEAPHAGRPRKAAKAHVACYHERVL